MHGNPNPNQPFIVLWLKIKWTENAKQDNFYKLFNFYQHWKQPNIQCPSDKYFRRAMTSVVGKRGFQENQEGTCPCLFMCVKSGGLSAMWWWLLSWILWMLLHDNSLWTSSHVLCKVVDLSCMQVSPPSSPFSQRNPNCCEILHLVFA